MADHYQEFSFTIDLQSEDQRQWWLNLDFTDEDLEAGLDFRFNLEHQRVWFYSHGYDYSSVEGCAEYIRKFLSEFQRNDIVWFEWVAYCSKPRIGEQQGGGVIITRHDTEYHSMYGVLKDRIDNFADALLGNDNLPV